MNNFKDLEDIWKQAPQEQLPDVATVIAEAKKETKKLSRKLILNAVSLILVIPVLIFLIVNYPFRVWTTYAGLGLMFFCIFGFVWFRVRDIRFLKRVDYGQPPARLLENYQSFYRQQKWVNGKLSFWYALMLNIAFLFYFYEVLWLSGLPAYIKIIFFVLYLVYMLFSTFYITKRYARKQEAAIAKIIASLQTERMQLEEEA